jgi:hypothetical protein
MIFKYAGSVADQQEGAHMKLKDYSSETLWRVLSDISKLDIMQEHPNDSEYFLCWEKISKAILLELDKRMESDY